MNKEQATKVVDILIKLIDTKLIAEFNQLYYESKVEEVKSELINQLSLKEDMSPKVDENKA